MRQELSPYTQAIIAEALAMLPNHYHITVDEARSVCLRCLDCRRTWSVHVSEKAAELSDAVKANGKCACGSAKVVLI